MSTNKPSKNVLQEYCQKRHISNPYYVTVRVPGTSSHEPLWRSNVTVAGNSFQGESMSTKVDAESHAASIALGSLIGNSGDDEVTYQEVKAVPSKGPLVIVDLENVPTNLHELEASKYNFNVLGFCTKTTCDQLKTDIPKVVVDSTRKNAADTAIIMVVACLLNRQENAFSNHIIVLSRDAVMSNIDEVASSPQMSRFFSGQVKIDHCVSIDECKRKAGC